MSLLLVAALFLAQNPAPLVRSNSRLVLLDVVVTDHAGHPISGLNQEDFTVLENGTPQKILSFESPFDAPNRAVAANKGSRTIILLDELNIEFSDLAYARDRIVLYLQQNPVAHQPTSLMAVGTHGLAMIQDFTQDGNRLMNRLTHLPAVVANPTDGYIDPLKSREHAEQALGALTQIARAAVGSPYSLNVVWVTSGFSGLLRTSNRSDGMEAGLRSVANLLIRSRMRLYTINPAGVLPLSPPNTPAISSRRSSRPTHESSAAQVLDSSHGEYHEADVMLGHMTAMMGGLSYYRRNDVEEALSQAILDGSSAYAISYAPSDGNFNGDYRTIEVRTKTVGAAARTRPGYYAIADDIAPDPGKTEARLKAALDSPLVYSGLNLTCPLAFDAPKQRLAGQLTVTPRPLVMEADETGQIIRAESLSESGKVLNSWSWRVNWKNSWTNRLVTAAFDKVLTSNTRTVRFLVSDPAANRIGTCEYRLP